MAFTQEVKPKSTMMTYPTELKAIGTSKPTTKFVMVKEKKYPIYQGTKGGLYYITEDKGQFKRHYIKN